MTTREPDIEFVDEPVQILSSTTLRRAEREFLLRVEGELNWDRFLGRLWTELGPPAQPIDSSAGPETRRPRPRAHDSR